jgi:putative transposase
MLSCLEFYTVSCFKKLALLEQEEHKQIIVQSLQYLNSKELIKLHAYVIMRNHFHLVWTRPYSSQIQSSFMKFIGQQFRKSLINKFPEQLELYKTNGRGREFRFFLKPYKEIIRSAVRANLAIGYINNNPVKAKIVKQAELYEFSSASFYKYGEDRFNFLTRIEEIPDEY